MGIKVADYMDPEDFDLVESSLELVEFIMADEDLDEEQQNILNKMRESTRAYVEKRDQLYAQSYSEISLLLYQTDKRGLYTDEELLDKIRSLKKSTKIKREELEYLEYLDGVDNE